MIDFMFQSMWHYFGVLFALVVLAACAISFARETVKAVTTSIEFLRAQSDRRRREAAAQAHVPPRKRTVTLHPPIIHHPDRFPTMPSGS